MQSADDRTDAPPPRAAPPQLRRELRYLAFFAVFGLLILPPCIYLAGVVTLGPYEGGLWAFLKSLYGALLTLRPTAWALLFGPYLLFQALRLLSRPLRRPLASSEAP